MNWLAVGVGAALGAWGRHALGILLNPLLRPLPLGTLAANLVGGFLMGMVMAWLMRVPTVSPELRLFITTGFLGGLTTFSAFSGETVALLLREEYLWAFGAITLHLGGSIAMTFAGYFLMQALQPA
ncbi:MAG: fluoride efflux transporter CrcB [Steroidobacteraceae bacterium]|nr:fluoride efflux transporter CrcB [Steroidobacteraceae bacterium]